MTPLSRTCHKALLVMLSQLTHLPGGYTWWHSFPLKGKRAAKNVVKRWSRLLTEHCYPIQLRQAMLLASLNDDGIPDARSMQLYTWTLRNLYRGNAASMYKEWQQLITVQRTAEQRRLLHSVPKKMPTLKPMPMRGMGTWHEYPPALHSITRHQQQHSSL